MNASCSCMRGSRSSTSATCARTSSIAARSCSPRRCVACSRHQRDSRCSSSDAEQASPHITFGRLRARLAGIDLSPDMIERAQATKLYDTLEVAEITGWLGRRATRDFDLIAACDTLIYFGDLRQVMRPVMTRLRPRGTFAFTVERAEDGDFRLTDSGRLSTARRTCATPRRMRGSRSSVWNGRLFVTSTGDPVEGLVAVCQAL